MFVRGVSRGRGGGWRWRWAGLAGLLAVMLAALPAPSNGALPDGYTFDVRGGTALVMLADHTLARRTAAGLERLGVTALSARFLPDGGIVFVDEQLALRRLDAAGVQQILPPGSANAPVFVSPDGGRLAYLKPRHLGPGETYPLTNGLAVLDLASGAEQVLLEVPGVTLGLYGWVGAELLFEMPAWDPARPAAPAQMQLALLPANGAGAPRPAGWLPPLAPGGDYPQTSFDQRFLAYQAPPGTVVVDLASRQHAVYAGVSAPFWTEAGLTVQRGAGRVALAWSAAELATAAPASQPLAWPPRLGEAPPGPALAPDPALAQQILMYRPVWATTRVSAYVDLDPAYNFWRNWRGQSGSGWVYGGSYDGHAGTDYDGRAADPVYASAPGTVVDVVVDCRNTYYNGGPRSFGTYVRLDNGLAADGQRYWTLYAHLKCDGVLTALGRNYPALPVVLAQMGNTGWSTGDHVHLQVYRNSYYATVDPYELRIIGDDPPMVRTTGDVRGVVRHADGQPAAGVLVKVYAAGGQQAAWTDAEGAYRLLNVPSGQATLTAVQGRRWGQLSLTVLPDQQVTAPGLELAQCRSATTAGEDCPAVLADQAAFVDDVTLPDGEVVSPGQPLLKTWRLRNTGTTTWDAGYQLVLIGGTGMAGADQPAVAVPLAAPGQEVDLSAALAAPAEPGLHRAYWRLRNPVGVYFGPTFWLEVDVQAPGAGGAFQVFLPYGADPSRGLAQPACAVRALPEATDSASFAVEWSGSSPAGVARYDIQFLDSGRGGWRPWLSGIPAYQTSAVFYGQPGHRYSFRCRTVDSANTVGSYPSAADTATLVAPAAGEPDLRLAGLAVVPNPAGGVVAQVTVQNQGSAATPGGFFTDLYWNQAPSGPGDYGGSLHLWVSEPLAAGATAVLSHWLVPGNTANGTLYAQVDSVGNVAESDESNNRYTQGVPVCLQPIDAFEPDDDVGQARSLAPGATQARNLGWEGDVDWVRVDVPAGRAYRVATSGLSSRLDTRLSVYGPDGQSLLAAHDDLSATSLASSVTWAATTPGPYYVRVDNWNPAAGGCQGAYNLSLVDQGPVFVTYLSLLLR